MVLLPTFEQTNKQWESFMVKINFVAFYANSINKTPYVALCCASLKASVFKIMEWSWLQGHLVFACRAAWCALHAIAKCVTVLLVCSLLPTPFCPVITQYRRVRGSFWQIAHGPDLCYCGWQFSACSHVRLAKRSLAWTYRWGIPWRLAARHSGGWLANGEAAMCC